MKPSDFTIQESVAAEAITLNKKVSAGINEWIPFVTELQDSPGAFIVTGDPKLHRSLSLQLHRAAATIPYNLTITGGRDASGKDGIHVRKATPEEAQRARDLAEKAKVLAARAKAKAEAEKANEPTPMPAPTATATKAGRG
jgi:hypothetical protein